MTSTPQFGLSHALKDSNAPATSGSSKHGMTTTIRTKATRAVAEEGTNIMAVWGTPEDCLEKIKFYFDALCPDQLMLNIASGSLPQEKALRAMRLFADEVMPAVRHFV